MPEKLDPVTLGAVPGGIRSFPNLGRGAGVRVVEEIGDGNSRHANWGGSLSSGVWSTPPLKRKERTRYGGE